MMFLVLQSELCNYNETNINGYDSFKHFQSLAEVKFSEQCVLPCVL